MASFHSRSNSLPSKSHPVMDDVENLVYRLKSSDSASTSSVDSLCSNLASLRHLQDGIDSLIQLPSVQQALSDEQGQIWISELLEASLGLIDLCGFSRDVIYTTKESVQELESSIRRNRGESLATSDEMNAYIASRKNIVRKVKKCIKNLKSSNQNSTALQCEHNDLNGLAAVLKEAQALDFSVLKYVLLLLSADNEKSKQRSWSFLSKFTQSSRVHSQVAVPAEEFCFLNISKSSKNMDNINMLKQLRSSEMTIQELEEGLEALFKSLVKTRVSLLNLLSH